LLYLEPFALNPGMRTLPEIDFVVVKERAYPDKASMYR